MIQFILKRCLYALAVLLAVGAIAFVLFRYVGDPVAMMTSEQDSASYRAELRERLGLDDPVVVQFGRFVWRAAHADFGVSYALRQPVSTLFAERIPATLELVMASALFALAFGIPIGVYSALRRSGVISQLFQILSLIGVSMPAFYLATLLILFFSVQLRVLPSFGRGDTVDLGWWTTGFLTTSGLKALILPVITLGLFQLTLVMRLVRAEMLEVLRTDYIKFAKARGLSKRAIYFGHALRNVLMPVITVTGVQVGSLIAFAVITETVFQWPGMGFLFIQAVTNADIPVMAPYLMLVALMFVILNLIVDLLYYAIDPRLRDGAVMG